MAYLIFRSIGEGCKPPRVYGRLCCLMFPKKASIRLPMHPFRLGRERFAQICSSAQALADRPCSADGSPVGQLSLTRICEPVAVATCKGALAIENRDSATTTNRRATEPCTAATVVAGEPFEQHRIAIPLALPTSAGTHMVVCQLNPVLVGCYLDGCNLLAGSRPFVRERLSRQQQSTSLQPPHIERRAFGGGPPDCAPVAPASAPAHFAPI
jgi:hypothetical protein